MKINNITIVSLKKKPLIDNNYSGIEIITNGP